MISRFCSTVGAFPIAGAPPKPLLLGWESLQPGGTNIYGFRLTDDAWPAIPQIVYQNRGQVGNNSIAADNIGGSKNAPITETVETQNVGGILLSHDFAIRHLP